jgi:hypothetical protein
MFGIKAQVRNVLGTYESKLGKYLGKMLNIKFKSELMTLHG